MHDDHEGDGAVTAQYALGHAEQELERLAVMGRLWEPFTTQVFRDAGLAKGMRVLDVGCGGGDVSFLVARLIGPFGHVVGVDRSPEAIATATRRARAQELSNIQFIVDDAGTLPFDSPFDSAVGRFMLMHNPDPIALLRHVAAHVRPGGVLIFQEPDWAGYRTQPALPTWDTCARWIVEALQGSGSDPYIGLKLPHIFTAAGLPTPDMYQHAVVALAPHQMLSANIAGLVQSLLPTMERLGIVSASEVQIATLPDRLRDELSHSGGVVVSASVIGAVVRKPME